MTRQDMFSLFSLHRALQWQLCV